MTQEEAQAEAVRRWGTFGFAVNVNRESDRQYRVGIDVGFAPIVMKGEGKDYESAFAEADSREAKKGRQRG